jgi:hypothetical protein
MSIQYVNWSDFVLKNSRLTGMPSVERHTNFNRSDQLWFRAMPYDQRVTFKLGLAGNHGEYIEHYNMPLIIKGGGAWFTFANIHFDGFPVDNTFFITLNQFGDDPLHLLYVLRKINILLNGYGKLIKTINDRFPIYEYVYNIKPYKNGIILNFWYPHFVNYFYSLEGKEQIIDEDFKKEINDWDMLYTKLI